MKEEEVLSLLKGGGGLHLGHFARNRDWHSDILVNKYVGAHNPAATERLCAELLRRFEGDTFDVVVVRDVTEDMILGYVCARVLDLTVACVYKEEGLVSVVPAEGIREGDRALVVADSFRTRDALKEIVTVVKSKGATIGGIGVLVDEGLEAWYPQLKIAGLLSLKEHLYTVESCPLCGQNVPLSEVVYEGKSGLG